MTSLKSMIDKLSPLGIYNLTEGSIVYSELAAFAVALDVVREQLQEIQREAFLSTAVDYGITSLEKLTGKVRDDLTIEKRRDMLIGRMSLCEGDFTLGGFTEMLKVLGVEGEILESPAALKMTLKLDDRVYSQGEKDWIVDQVKSLFPAHLESDVVFSGFTWADSDSKNHTFAQIESKGMIWYEIDYML